MPLRLKSLELHGYKTFASRTKFEFSDKITAIVGPNGSGKSNIADSLRWALGEQSYSILRGKKTEDMIFAGSDNRARAGMASVVLSFDNSNNWLPIDFSEVDLSRRAFRDGKNDYLLNNQQIRLKDLNELLAQSGLSERTYTILGQGLVDASLALKADERRKLFEEAAGIGLYRARRVEALKRLDITTRNLDRVLDILAELQPRLKSLEKQAKKATEYQQLQKDLKTTLLSWYGFHWKNSQKEMNQARELLIDHKSKVEEARLKYQSIRDEFLGYRENLQSLRSRLNSWHRESSNIHSSRETLSLEMAVLEERRNRLEENRKGLMIDLGKADARKSGLQDRLITANKELEQLEVELQDAKDQLTNSQRDLETKRKEKHNEDEILAKAIREKDIFINQLDKLQIQYKELSNKLLEIQADLGEKLIEVKNLEDKERILDEERTSEALKIKELERDLEVETNHKKQLNSRLESSINNRDNLYREISDLDTEISGLNTRLEVFLHSEETMAGYAEGTKIILESSRKKLLSSKINSINSLVDIPPKFESAISAALGDFVDSLIIESESDLEQAIAVMDSHNEGRATILPLKKLIYEPIIKITKEEKVIGFASELVNVDAEYRPAIDFLLNRFIIVEDRETATRILRKLPDYLKVVTIQGDIYFANGPIRTGKVPVSGILSRKRSIKELKEDISKKEENKQSLSSKLKGMEQEIFEIQEELNDHQNQISLKELELIEYKKNMSEISLRIQSTMQSKGLFEEQRSRLESELSNSSKMKDEIKVIETDLIKKIQEKESSIKLQASTVSQLSVDGLLEQVTYWTSQVAVAEHALNDLKLRCDEYSMELTKQENTSTEMEIKFREYEKSINDIDFKKMELREQELEISQQLEKLQTLIDPAEAELENAIKYEGDLQEKETQSQSSLAKIERLNNQIQMDFERKQEAVDILRQKIEDDFGLVEFDYETNVDGPVPLPFEGMVEQLNSLDVLPPNLEETLTHQRILLRRLGPVNPEAQKEYQSVSDRHAFLETQMEDLKKAIVDTKEVIAELDEITRQEFFKTFTSVAEEFKKIFHRLFGGGSATLLLTDPENLTETGIDIEARLPGRREQGLALLSGGERSLTAIALIFSLLRVSPTPVCVMDEVDAMLDEANVGRFRDLLQELSQDTQFIVITHNRNTVQAADVIYGVTMSSDSVSQVISLKLDQVSEDYLKSN